MLPVHAGDDRTHDIEGIEVVEVVFTGEPRDIRLRYFRLILWNVPS